MENAVVHNVTDGWVRVRAGTNDGHAYLEVANSGPVVSEDELPHLFEPFRRADARIGSSGVGLGLSIVESVGEAHGARVNAQASPGGGLVVSVTMPSRPASLSCAPSGSGQTRWGRRDGRRWEGAAACPP